MIRLSRAIALVAFVTSGAPPLLAQGGAFNPLAPSVGLLSCQSLPPTDADSASVVLHVTDSSSVVPMRESVIAYDSVGTPLFMTVSAREKTGDDRKHALVIRFEPVRRGARMLIGADGEPDSTFRPDPTVSAPDLPPGATPLMTSEIIRARDLAVWVWARRCK